MDSENPNFAHHWFDSTFILLNKSYQFDLRRIISTDAYQLLHKLCDFYMYDCMSLLIHLLGLTSHYLTTTSFVYADNQLRHKLNLHLLLIAREGYERSSIVEHIKQAINNVQSIRQTGKQFDIRYRFNSNVFCQSDDFIPLTSGFCISDNFDEHGTTTHIQRQQSSSIMGTTNGDYIRQILIKKKFDDSTNWLMIFLATKPRLFCRRSKIFDFNQYPTIEHWVIMINCLCSSTIDFYFEQTQANQLMCDYLDTLSLKAKSLENVHPSIASRYLSAQEHVLRISVSLCIIQMTVEILFIYQQTFHTFGQADKLFFDNSIRIIEQTKGINNIRRIYINSSIVQSAIYFVNMSIKQFEIMFEPLLTTRISHQDHSSISDESRLIRPASSPSSPPAKRSKSMIDASYLKSLELAHELLLLPFVAFTRTSVYGNSKIKRYAVYLDLVIEQLKKTRLIIIVRQGVQMVDGTRRRVDLIVKSVPILNENETYDKDLMERLNQYNVNYDQYIQTLGTLDIGEKYRLSEKCFDLLNSSDYKRYLTINLERLAPIHRVQPEEEEEQEEDDENDDDVDFVIDGAWKSSSSSLNIKIERGDFYV